MNELMLAFWFFAGVCGLSVLLLSFSKRLIYAAFLLFATLVGVAAMYVFLGAEFLAVAQLVVYVGGILVLIMFGIMLTQREGEPQARTAFANVLPALILGGVVFTGLLYLWHYFRLHPPGWIQAYEASSATGPDSIEKIGIQTLTRYLLPFEFMSVLLLLALVGAAYLARRGSQSPSEP